MAGPLNILGTFQDPLNLDIGAGKLVNVRMVPRQQEVEGKPGKARLLGTPGLPVVCRPTVSACIAINHALNTVWSAHADGSIYYGVETGTPTLAGSVAVNAIAPVIRLAEDRTALAIASNRNVLGPQYSGTAYTATQGGGVVNAGFDSSINFDPSALVELDNMAVWSGASNVYANQSDKMYRAKALEPATVNPNWFGTAEARADRIVDLALSGRVMWPLGSRSLEQWYNAGDGTDFPFTPFPNSMEDVGIASRTSLAQLRGTIGFVGTDKRLWRCSGQTAKASSPPWIDLLLQQLSSAQLAALTSYAYGQGGSDFYVLTLPGAWTLELAVNYGAWCYRQSPGRADHAARCATEHDDGTTYVGLDTGHICALDFNSTNEPAGRIERTVITPYIGNPETYSTIHDVLMTSSLGPAAGTFDFSWSADGANTWRGARTITFPEVGKRRAIARQLGSERMRQFRFQYSGATAPFEIDELYTNIKPGQ